MRNLFSGHKSLIALFLALVTLLAGAPSEYHSTALAYDCGGTFPQRITSGFSFACGGLTFNNFDVMWASTGTATSGEPQVDLTGAILGNNQVTLLFNPNLGGNATSSQDIWLWFQVNGNTSAVSLNLSGSKATVTEDVCTQARSKPNFYCRNGAVASLAATNNTGADISAYTNGPEAMVSVFKDIGVAPGGSMSSFSQTFTIPSIPTLQCTPANQTAALNQTVSFSATGGNGTFTWTDSSGAPATGSGANFTATYTSSGDKAVTVTSGGQTATCTVHVTTPVVPPVVCTPATQTVAINQTANLSASGGNGTFTWSAPSGSPATGTSASFSSSFATAGNKTVTVTSGSQTANCAITVTTPAPPVLQCTPNNNPVIESGAPIAFSALGGNGTYSWTATNGTSGTTNSFTTSFTQPGSQSATVTSGSQTATCAITVHSTPPAPKSFTVTPANYCVGTNQTYQITATSNLANMPVSASTVSSPIGSTASSVVGTTDNNAQLFITGRTWTTNDIGHWKRVFSIDTAAPQTVEFDVRDCTPPPVYGNITISKLVKNISTGSGFAKSANASTGQRIAYQITVTANNGLVNNVSVSDSIPSNITYVNGTAKLDNAIVSDSYANSAALGTLTSGQSRTLYFEAYATAIGTQCQTTTVNTATASGQNTATVSDSASVYISQTCGGTYTPPQLVCSPNTQTAFVNSPVTFYATGGTGSYSWSAADANPYAGSNQNFTTTYSATGSHTIILTSGSQTAYCNVTVNNQPVTGNVNLRLSKSAVNDTKSGHGIMVDATSIPASKEDYITYTLKVQNTGTIDSSSFAITDDLSQVLPFADITDNGGGTVTGKTITYPGIIIPAGGSVSKSFTVRVKYFLADSLAYTMTNTYGNTVVIHINTPQVKGAFIAPKTGANTTAVLFAGVLTAGYAVLRKRKNLLNIVLN